MIKIVWPDWRSIYFKVALRQKLRLQLNLQISFAGRERSPWTAEGKQNDKF